MEQKNEILIDGKYSFRELVDISRLKAMFESFSNATGFTTGLISYPDQEVLISTGWRDICTQFHRACPDSAIHCKQSNIELTARLVTQKEISIRQCANGLVDGATPIIVHGTHVANLATGQILFKKPDKEWFRKQGQTYGYDREAYLASLEKVPVVTEDAFRNALRFLSEISVMIAEQSLAILQSLAFTEDSRRNEEQLRIILNSIGDAMIATDAKGRVTLMNPAAENLTEWGAGAACGKALRDIFPIINAKTRETINNPIESVLASGKITGLANHTILISKSGKEHQIADSAAPITDNKGQISGVVLVFRDVTEKYRIEEALRESEFLLQESQEVARMGSYVLDIPSGRWKSSRVLDEIFGIDDKYIRSVEGWASLTHPEWRKIMEDYFTQQVLGQRFRFDKEYQIIRRDDGEVRWVHGLGKLEFDARNHPIKMIGTIQDITERKRTEAELQKIIRLTSVGTLAGGIAHDFNNILMGFFGKISLAKAEIPKDHPGFTYLEEAERSMFRAIRLTKQLLTFAKGGDPVKDYVSLGALIEEVARFDLSGSNVELVHHHADDLWLANADKGQIQQVISNLTTNARQAMPNGGHLYITAENTEIKEGALLNLQKGKYIKLTLRDEGTGIDPKIIDRIFEPYFTTKHTGNGLGLATSYSIVSKHGGHIAVASELGKGSTFTLYLPASESQNPAENKQTDTPSPSLKPSLKVLLLDDEPSIRMVIPRWLQQMGCLVTACADGCQTIEAYKQSMEAGNPFDILLLDLTIPGGIGGKEVLREILSMNPTAKAIISSGYAKDPIMANHALHGFKDVLDKPYTKDQLQKVLAKVMEPNTRDS